jgi:ribonucleoside-diphosphate reductase alpha chain
LLPFEVCNLGAINLTKFVKDEEFKIKEFIDVVKIAVRFLNRVIDCNYFPLEQIRDMVNGTRKIGLGVMGLADFFILLKIRYGEIESLDLANKVFEILAKEAWEESYRLGETLGGFGKATLWEKKKDYQLKGSRNSAITTVAPTGTTSIIPGVSSGIEPLFRVKYKRTDTFGVREIVHPLFERIDYDKYSKYVRVAEEIQSFEHLEMQAIIQKWVDSAVSKTINLKNSATVEDIEYIYKMAWEKKCKGVTIFRQGSKKGVME